MSPLDKNDNLQRYIRGLPTPSTQEEALAQFQKLYDMVSINDWLEGELVFDLGNFILRYRPDLISLGIRLNVQVNLFLRTIEKYAADPDTIFYNIGHSVGCFALTEQNAGVLSGLIVDTTWEENPETGEYILNNPEDNQKNWISQGTTASYAIVYARHVEDKSDIRIFMINLLGQKDIISPITIIPINNTLDMARLRFTNLTVPETSCLELSKKSSKLELLNGIFFGRYMIAEATISAMLGQIEHIQQSINGCDKFERLGFVNYLTKCYNEFDKYKSLLYKNRRLILYSDTANSLFLTNCYKIYTVEKSIQVFNKLQLMFGMRAATSDLKFENLLLHKVAEGDTYVLRISLINNHFKSGWFQMLTKRGFSFQDLYYLYQKETRREKMDYIMENFQVISDNIINSTIPKIDC